MTKKNKLLGDGPISTGITVESDGTRFAESKRIPEIPSAIKELETGHAKAFYELVEQEWREKWKHVRKVYGVAKLIPNGWDPYRGMFKEEEAHKLALEESKRLPYLFRVTCDAKIVAMYAEGKEIKE